jgi:hypothetical protein
MELRLATNTAAAGVHPCPTRLFLSVTSRVLFLLHELGEFGARLDPASGAAGPSAAQHLLLCAALLRASGCDASVCDAAALHSVYGTSCSPRGLSGGAAARARVAAAAGARAERLARLFSLVERPACLLALAERDAPAALPLRARAGARVEVSRGDAAALLDMEAANLVDRGHWFLREVDAAPPRAPLREAVERLRSVAARAAATLPPVAPPPPPPPPPRGCFSCWRPCGPLLPLRAWPCGAAAAAADAAPLPPLAAELPSLVPGCFLVDGPAGGPLCPPHLSPARLLPPSPAHAALPAQLLGEQAPCAAAEAEALEEGVCTPPPQPPGRAVTCKELRAAAAESEAAGADAAPPPALAEELAALLAAHGYFVVDATTDDAGGVVDGAFAAAGAFFGGAAADKARARWRSGALRKQAGFRGEGPRELFAVRDDEGEESGGQWPAAEWRALFRLQRALARDIFALLCARAGAARGRRLAALFGAAEEGAPAAASPPPPPREACADVLRVYRYARPAGGCAPGLRAAATGAHADVGLLTLAPLSAVPGLALLSPCGRRWVDVEGSEEARRPPPQRGARRFVAFLGEAGARVLASGARAGGAPPLRAPVHFVLERAGGAAPRFSAPFFLRAPHHALLAPGATNGEFLQALAQRPWARLRDADQSPALWAADF